MPLSAGAKLGPYEILQPIGAGGMGQVYLARDTRLGRKVALKVLHEEASPDKQSQARFEQEAKSASALNHPNIACIYDIGSEHGIGYIVSELVDGESLRQLIARGPLATDKLVAIAIQLASAMSAAHSAGIVHRDLKPENIVLTLDGHPKILDFGLAKQINHPASQPESAETFLMTEPGVVLGTVSYMSPEQLRAQPADARSDIFSLGGIFYEMASGTRAFSGISKIDLMGAILNLQPPPLPRHIDSSIDFIIRKCLEKAPDLRFQRSSDLLLALERAGDALDRLKRPTKEWTLTNGLVSAIALLVGTLCAVAFWASTRSTPPPPPPAVKVERAAEALPNPVPTARTTTPAKSAVILPREINRSSSTRSINGTPRGTTIRVNASQLATATGLRASDGQGFTITAKGTVNLASPDGYIVDANGTIVTPPPVGSGAYGFFTNLTGPVGVTPAVGSKKFMIPPHVSYSANAPYGALLASFSLGAAPNTLREFTSGFKLVGAGGTVTAPPGGGYLSLIINDDASSDNLGGFSVTIMPIGDRASGAVGQRPSRGAPATGSTQGIQGQTGVAESLVRVVQSGDLAVLRTRLSLGANPNQADDSAIKVKGWTPLMAAAYSGNIDAAILLLDAGAAVESKTEFGRTALEVAVASDKPRVAELLRSRGATLPKVKPDIPLSERSMSGQTLHSMAGPIRSELKANGVSFCLDVPEGNFKAGTRLIIWPCQGGPNQEFTSGRDYKLTIGGFCVNAFAGTDPQVHAGTPVGLWQCGPGGANESWVRQSDGHYLGWGGLCMAVSENSSVGGAYVVMSPCEPKRAGQLWSGPGKF